MEPAAERDQGSIYRDQQKSAHAYPRQLDHGLAVSRAERQPRHATDDRQPEVAQLTDRRERPVDLRQCQWNGKAGTKAEQHTHGHKHHPVRRRRENWHLRRIDDAKLDLFGLGVGRIGDLGGFGVATPAPGSFS